jgi:hypothetical protein
MRIVRAVSGIRAKVRLPKRFGSLSNCVSPRHRRAKLFHRAQVAQSVEQLIRNEQVAGSIPALGSRKPESKPRCKELVHDWLRFLGHVSGQVRSTEDTAHAIIPFYARVIIITHR